MFNAVPYTTFENPFEKLFGGTSECADFEPVKVGECPVTRTITIDPPQYSITQSRLEAKDLFPKVKRVLFNEPVTKVWFDDGTSSTVKCSKEDSFSKDAGLAFAILKRLFGTVDQKNQAQSDGYMCELSRIIKGAYDQKAAEAKKNPPKKNPPKKTSGGAKEKPKGARKNSGGKKS